MRKPNQIFYSSINYLTFLVLAQLFISCSDGAQIAHNNGVFKIKIPPAKVGNFEIRPWNVGPEGKDVVSKGFRMQIKLPQFNNADLKVLLKTGALDSLLIKLKRRTYSESRTLDTFLIPLGRIIPGTKADYIITQLREINLLINYSAASSSRLLRLMCPAMNHRYEITEVEKFAPLSKESNYLIDVKTKPGEFYKEGTRFNSASHMVSGGKSLIGTYYLEMAFYNSISRQKVGNFLPISERLKIASEQRVDIPSCNNPENRDKTLDSGVNSFKFGK